MLEKCLKHPSQKHRSQFGSSCQMAAKYRIFSRYPHDPKTISYIFFSTISCALQASTCISSENAQTGHSSSKNPQSYNPGLRSSSIESVPARFHDPRSNFTRFNEESTSFTDGGCTCANFVRKTFNESFDCKWKRSSMAASTGPTSFASDPSVTSAHMSCCPCSNCLPSGNR